VISNFKYVGTLLLPILWGFLWSCGGGGGGAGSENLPPVASASSDRIVTSGSNVLLDGSASVDPDGNIVSYQWFQTEGENVELIDASSASAKFVAPQADSRKDLGFKLVVQDDAGAQGYDEVPITINAAPKVNAGPDQFVYAGETVTLVSEDSDSDGTIVEHLWRQIAGPEIEIVGADEPIAHFTTSEDTATYVLEYKATDNDGAEQIDTISVFSSRILFSDSFENTSMTNWIEGNDSDNLAYWDFDGGELKQYYNVTFGALAESYHLGTYVYPDQSLLNSRSSFRLSLDITPLTNDGDGSEGNDVGIMFPFDISDPQNYYRLSMNSRYGFTRLEKRDGVNFETLAVNSIGYIDGQPINIAIEVIEGSIFVFIDGEPVFAESDLDIQPGTVALYCQDRVSFDNLVIAENSPQPMVIISSPLSLSVLPFPEGNGASLTTRAIIANMPTDSRVVFSLNDGPPIDTSVSGNTYSAAFNVDTYGDYDVVAAIIDANNNELGRDVNTVVGMGGDYYITVGDSITNGSKDENPTNNNSADGRMVARQGFQARLNDELTIATERPQIIFNEGIGGDKSQQLNEDRIDSIIDRHPQANKMLLLIGTNDVWASVPVDDFEDHVMQVINIAMTDSIEELYIARIPPFYNDQQEVLNSRVAVYNARIEQIAAVDPSDSIFLGPDFYAIFEGKVATYYSSDGVHPNDAGYQAMADGWKEILLSIQ